MNGRTIKQITSSDQGLYALCEDGTLWHKTLDTNWRLVDPIPAAPEAPAPGA